MHSEFLGRALGNFTQLLASLFANQVGLVGFVLAAALLSFALPVRGGTLMKADG